MNSSNFALSASVNGRAFLFLRAVSISMFVVMLKGFGAEGGIGSRLFVDDRPICGKAGFRTT